MRRITWRGGVFVGAAAAAALLGPSLTREAHGAVVFNFTYFESMGFPGTGFFDPALGPSRRAALEAVALDIGSRIG